MDSTCADGFKGLRILRNLSETEKFSCHCGIIFKTPMRLQEHIDLFHSCSSIFIDLNGDVLWRDYNANKKKPTRKVGPLCYQKLLPSIEEEPVIEDEDDDERNKIMNANVQPSYATPAAQSESESEAESEPDRITNDQTPSKESPNVSNNTESLDSSSPIPEQQKQRVQSPNDQCMTLTSINLETGKVVYNCDSPGPYSTVVQNVSLPSPQNIIVQKPASAAAAEMEYLDFHLEDEVNNRGQAHELKAQNYTNTFSQRGEIYGNWSVVKCETNETGVSKLSSHAQNPTLIYNRLEYEGIQNSENIHQNQHHHNDQNPLESLNTTSMMMSNDSLTGIFSPVHQSTMDNEARRGEIALSIPIRMKIEDGILINSGDCCSTSGNISFNMRENVFHAPPSPSSMMTRHDFSGDQDQDQDEDDIYLTCQETVLGSMAKSPELPPPSDDTETTLNIYETSTSRRKAKRRKKSFDAAEPTRSLRSLPGRPKRFCK